MTKSSLAIYLSSNVSSYAMLMLMSIKDNKDNLCQILKELTIWQVCAGNQVFIPSNVQYFVSIFVTMVAHYLVVGDLSIVMQQIPP